MLINYGKYKGVIISVALFLLLDASVLIINFYTSFQISKDAIAVNLAGRQRMLSQRSMKALLDMQLSQANSDELLSARTEVANVANLFNDTLIAFDQGGEVQGTGAEKEILDIVATPQARIAVDDTKVLWSPFYEKVIQLTSLSNTDANYQSLLTSAIAYGKNNNLTILSQMNDLTVEMENIATSKATRLRIIQTVGIILAVINFFIIMVHFIRQLRESDEKIESAQKQTDDILETVDQGLFLLDQDLKISDKHSNEMYRIFGAKKIGGTRFIDFIKDMVSSTDRGNIERFFNLLFDPSKKQRLLGDLNPLKQVAIQVPDGKNGHTNKHLKFLFRRVEGDDGVDNVLTSVTDITQQVKLTQELENVKNRNDQQLEMVSVLLNADSTVIPMFLKSSASAYEKINKALEETTHTDREYRDKASDIFALIHNVKGEASSLKLDVIAELCHDFEAKVALIQQQKEIVGNDFLSLTVILDQLMTYDSLLEEMHEKIYLNKSNEMSTTTIKPRDWTHLRSLADEIADRQGKKVEVTMAGLNDTVLSPDFVMKLNSIMVQFLRNAVTHGIESTEQRMLAGKSETGLITISLAELRNRGFRFMFSDDGRGIDREKLLQVAQKRMGLSELETKALSSKGIGHLMFQPNVSQQSQIDMDSGRGIGLYSVRKIIAQMAGKITIKEVSNRGLAFIIDFPAKANQALEVA